MCFLHQFVAQCFMENQRTLESDFSHQHHDAIGMRLAAVFPFASSFCVVQAVVLRNRFPGFFIRVMQA